MNIQFKRIFQDAIIPTLATNGSAGFDLYVPNSSHISSLDGRFGKNSNRALIGTGISIQIPAGFAGLVCPRSGLAYKFGLTLSNTPGIIDSDYRGEIKVAVVNNGELPFVFTPGMRLAQLLITPVYSTEVSLVEVEALDDTDRGHGGFGSTGE
jgi:dUTP pyrophosphatase